MSQTDDAGTVASQCPARSGSPLSNARRARERRALPSWAIDLIRDGVPREDLQQSGQRAVWNALGRTALSAINAGHSRPEWEYEVTRPVSRLGVQNRLRADGRERTAQAARKALNAAWERAEERASQRPAWSTEAAREEAHRRAQAVGLIAADADVPLADPQRALLAYAAEVASGQGSVSVNLPRVATAQATGLGEKAVRLNLDRLVERGLLDLVERGRARTRARPGRANVYRLPDEAGLRLARTSLSRETRQVGPERQSGGPLPRNPTGPTHHKPQPPTGDRGAPSGRRRGSVVPTVGEVRAHGKRQVEEWLKSMLSPTKGD